MAFPPDILDRIRAHFPLSAFIGRFVPLKRAGREHTGLCPFHGEKTPSFTVNDQKQFFHCFGCAAHGDVIEFVKRYERLSYPEAVEKLAREAGIALPAFTHEAQAQFAQRKSLLEAMEAACRYFETQLKRQDSMHARDYVQSRGLAPETLARFRMGYAGEAREGLKTQLLKEGFSEAQLVEAGLLIRPESGPTYDRFRTRIIIPIRDGGGRVIAFGGRLMDGAFARHAPKYLNSPETPLFKKGEVLFNLDLAANAARSAGTIAVVEGYMDAIMMAQYGFESVVATLGTAVTEPHLRALWRHVPEPILCLDGDSAGRRAMMRAAELALPLLTPGYGLKFAQLPPGEDPDSLVRTRGAQALRQVLDGAAGLSDTLWRVCSAESAASAEGKAALEYRLMGMAARVKDATVQKHVRAFFRAQLWPQKGKTATPARSASHQAMGAPPRLGGLQVVRQLLKLVLLQPALLHRPEVEEYMTRLECVNVPLSSLREALLIAAHEPALEDYLKLYEHLQNLGFSHVISSLLKDEAILVPREVMESPEGAFRAWCAALAGHQRAALEEEKREIEQRLKQDPGNEEEYSKLLALQEQIRHATKGLFMALHEESDEAY